MTDASISPQSKHPTAAGVNSSGPFNESAQSGVSLKTIKGDLAKVSLTVINAAGDLTAEDLGDINTQIKALQTLVLSQKADRLFERMLTRIEGLSDPEAKGFGKSFVSTMKDVDCKLIVDSDLKCMAAYRSYCTGRGFINQVALNPERVGTDDMFVSSVAHEYIHAFQKRAAPALHLSPFNPDTKAIIHPADWIMLEAACERDAYTKQAFINSLLSKINPSVRQQASFDIVTPNELDKVRENVSLADALVSTALKSLSKPVKASQPKGRTFVNNYQDVALDNYAVAMGVRGNNTEYTFIRLELPDLWQVGNYNVGPNSLGEFVMEPLFLKHPPLLEDAQKQMDELCATYKIPPLEKCQSLREYNNREHTVPEPARPITARAPASMELTL